MSLIVEQSFNMHNGQIQQIVFKLYAKYVQMAYRKESAMCVWSHKLLIISCIQLWPINEISPAVEQSFDMYNVLIQYVEFK